MLAPLVSVSRLTPMANLSKNYVKWLSGSAPEMSTCLTPWSCHSTRGTMAWTQVGSCIVAKWRHSLSSLGS